MSKIADVIVWNQQLSITAGEEAARLGHPEIDVDHLLLALLLTEGAAGQHLRAAGMTLQGTRQAIEDEHAERLRLLGITAPEVVPRPLQDLTGRSLDWSPRALTVVRERSEQPTDLALLRALLDERSGLVDAVLRRLGVGAVALRRLPDADADTDTDADAAADPDAGHPSPPTGGDRWLALSHTGFVPVPVPRVWDLLQDPVRRPEWDATVGGVEPLGPRTWRAAPPQEGSPSPADQDAGTELRLLHQVQDRLLEWEGTWRGPRRSGRQRLRVELEPVTGGTRTRLTLAVPTRPGWRGVVRRVLGPAHRMIVRQLLVAYTTGISRALRQTTER